MNILFSMSRATTTAKIAGSIREKHVSALKDAFIAILTIEQKTVHFDLSSVPHICSSALGTIIILYRQLRDQGRKLHIKGIHKNLYSLFTSMNLQKVILIEMKDGKNCHESSK